MKVVRKIFNLVTLGMMLLGFCFLVACSKVNEKNYAKIQPGMSLQQVITILGQPASSDSIGFGGFSGTSVVWKNKNVIISVQFLNDKVQIKSMSREGEKQVEATLPSNKSPKN